MASAGFVVQDVGMVKPGPRDPSEWRQLDEFELRQRLRERRSEQDDADADDPGAAADVVAAAAVPLAARDLDDVVIGQRPDVVIGQAGDEEDVPEPEAIGGAIGGILDVGAAAADMALTLAEQAAKTAGKTLELGVEYTGRAAEKMGDFLVGSSPPEGGDGGGDGDGDGDDDSGNGTGGPTLGGGALEGGDFLSGAGSGLGGGHRSSEDGGDVFVDPAVVFEPNDEPVIAEQLDPIGDGGDGLVDDIG
jgi:hypothetical protein